MSRKRDGPSRFLKGFRGYLQADAFSGYDGIYAGGDVVEVGCNAHARRKFIEAQTTDTARASCGPGLLPPALRDREGDQGRDRQAAARTPTNRRGPRSGCGSARSGRSRSGGLRDVAGRASSRTCSPRVRWAARSVTCRTNWEALKRYTSSGYLSIDNNVSEQHMKTIATGRKNWLFTGSENGGKTMAVLFSVVSSCQRHGHDPFVYLRDVLARLPDHPKEQLAELLPDRWSPPKVAEPATTTERPIAAGSSN